MKKLIFVFLAMFSEALPSFVTSEMKDKQCGGVFKEAESFDACKKAGRSWCAIVETFEDFSVKRDAPKGSIQSMLDNTPLSASEDVTYECRDKSCYITRAKATGEADSLFQRSSILCSEENFETFDLSSIFSEDFDSDSYDSVLLDAVVVDLGNNENDALITALADASSTDISSPGNLTIADMQLAPEGKQDTNSPGSQTFANMQATRADTNQETQPVPPPGNQPSSNKQTAPAANEQTTSPPPVNAQATTASPISTGTLTKDPSGFWASTISFDATFPNPIEKSKADWICDAVADETDSSVVACQLLDVPKHFEGTSARRVLQEISGKYLHMKLKFEDESRADAARGDLEKKVQVAAVSAGVGKPILKLQPKRQQAPINTTKSPLNDPWVPTPCDMPKLRDQNSNTVEIMAV